MNFIYFNRTNDVYAIMMKISELMIYSNLVDVSDVLFFLGVSVIPSLRAASRYFLTFSLARECFRCKCMGWSLVKSVIESIREFANFVYRYTQGNCNGSKFVSE